MIPDADAPCWLFDYKLGWVRIEDPLRWPESGGELERTLRDSGYYTFASWLLGRDIDYVVKVYMANDKAEYPAPYTYAMEVGDDSPYLVFVNNLPSLVELMAKLAPFAEASLLSSIAEDVRALIERQAALTARADEEAERRRGATLASRQR